MAGWYGKETFCLARAKKGGLFDMIERLVFEIWLSKEFDYARYVAPCKARSGLVSVGELGNLNISE